jgi:hypothetical protein
VKSILSGRIISQDSGYQVKPIIVKDNLDVYENSCKLIKHAKDAYKNEIRVFQVHFYHFIENYF